MNPWDCGMNFWSFADKHPIWASVMLVALLLVADNCIGNLAQAYKYSFENKPKSK